MTHHTSAARRLSGMAAMAVVAAAAAGLAGCKSSASGSGQSGPAASATAAADSGGSGGSGSSGGSGGSSSGADYFPVAQGNTWVYDASKVLGSKSTVTDKIIRVVPVAGGKKVTMRTLETGGTKLTTTYVFHNDGSISVPFGSVAGSDVKVVGGSGVFWPSVADSAPGTTRKTTLVLEGSSTGRVTAHISVTSGGSKTVTVPAGTYDARSVIETIREKVDGHTLSIKLVTYLARGVGPVKTSLGGSVGETLKSFTRG